MLKNNLLSVADNKTIICMRYLMGTFVQIEASGERREQTVEAINAAFSEMSRIESVFSKYIKESYTHALNNYGFLSPQIVSAEYLGLLNEAIKFSEITEGAFDVTVNPFINLWERAQHIGTIPSATEIREASLDVGWNNIIIQSNNSILLRNRRSEIDFGGIGKGYAIDRAVDVLKRHDIKNALINVGGQIYCFGDDGSDIGIRSPKDPDYLIDSIFIKNRSIATSANYERCFHINGKQYSHIIDPRTGFPVRNDVLSVSITSPSATIADILSTSIFILGVEKGMKLIKNLNNLKCIIITRKAKNKLVLHKSSGIKCFP